MADVCTSASMRSRHTARHQGAVTSLITYGAVTVAWIDRLAAINEEMAGLFNEELAELREGCSGT